MRCPSCQTDNPDSKKFCRKCGAKLVLVCAQCGAACLPGDEFCGDCGASLSKTPAPATVDYSQPQTYTPKFLADKILSSGKALEGERKIVTVLFADLAGYTPMSEKLDPEEVHQIMEGCFQILMDEIHRFEGTIDKFTGDGVMALFGAPLAHEDHAQRACYAALSIQKSLESYGQKIEKEYKIPFKMRIGLNTGPVIVGSVGHNLKMEYSAVGDTVNLASRMQTMAEPGHILTSREVYRMARDFFNFKSRGKLTVKGKEDPVEAYELLEPTEIATRIEASVLRGLTRFVGREKEMATLRDSFDKARSGSGQVVCIVGEAGVGKSRLLLELRRSLSTEDHTYIEGHCLHYGSSMPYLPLLDVLRFYFSLKEGEREFLIRKRLEEKISSLDPNLRSVLPPLQELLSLKVEDEAYLKLEPQKKRERIFEAIRDLLVVESRRKPLLVAIDDFQWTDRTSEEFLSYFIGHLPNSRVLLLLLYRPEFTHQWSSRSCYSQIRVDELPTKSSADLVRAMLEEGEVAPELRELILNRAAGNPLFMEEFTHTLLENGSIQIRDHQYVLSRKPSEIIVPDTIQGIIAARMDRLDDNLKRIMQVASVIGRDFAYRILQTITGMQEELKGHLLNLQGLEFIYEKSLFPELEYVFKHALTQEVAYNSLLLKRRKQIHERIGRAIEELYPDRLEEFCEALAHHYSTAENPEKAFHYLRMSAGKAHRSYATQEAYRYYNEALEVLRHLPDTEENKCVRVDITISAYSVMVALNFPEGALAIAEEALRSAELLDNQAAAVRFYSQIGVIHLYAGRHPKALEYSRKAYELAEHLGNETAISSGARALCSLYLTCGEPVPAADVAARALGVMDKASTAPGGNIPEVDQYVTLLQILGWARAMLGDFDEGERLCLEAIHRASEVHSQYSLAGAHMIAAVVQSYRGKPGVLLQHAGEARRLCEEAQMPVFGGTCLMLEGFGHLYQGDLDAASECARKSISLTSELSPAAQFAPSFIVSGAISAERGELPQARQSLEEAIKLASNHNEKHMEGHARMYLGWVLALEDPTQIAAAEKTIMEGLKMVEDLQIKPLQALGHLCLGEAHAVAGQKEKALASLRRAHDMGREMDMDYLLVRTEKALAELGGQVAC